MEFGIAERAIDALLAQNKRAVVAIDGRCGAGKSTLANAVAQIYSADIIHMDDFFLSAELRTKERLSSPGGNVHYERFFDEVVLPLNHGGSFSYRVFDCTKMDFSSYRTVNANGLILIEGAYSHHPYFAAALGHEPYNLRVFMDISPTLQRERIIARGGGEAYQSFERMWIPLEEAYIGAYDIKGKAGLVLLSPLSPTHACCRSW